MDTIKIVVCLEHAPALKLYQMHTGREYPDIPPGQNTLIAHFKVEGRCAVLINQRGFMPQATDNEQEINGCCVAIAAEDDISDDEARAALDRWAKGILEVE